MSRIHRRDPRDGERVRVHMNLNEGVLSVKPGAPAEDAGLVITQTPGPIHLIEPEFFVSESGVDRIRKERTRQVVAWIWGEYSEEEPSREGRRAILDFDPFEGPKAFMDSVRNRPVGSALSLTVQSEAKPAILANSPNYL